MKVMVIKWSAKSSAINGKASFEIGYPAKSYAEALKTFKKEFPAAKQECISAYAFDSKKRPDLYAALNVNACLRF